MMPNWNILESGVKYRKPFNLEWFLTEIFWKVVLNSKNSKIWNDTYWNIVESVYCQIPKTLKSETAILNWNIVLK